MGRPVHHVMLSETEAERRLAELRSRRTEIDRGIADLALYLELGRRLSGPEPSVEPAGAIEPSVSRRESVRQAEEVGERPEGAAARRRGRALVAAALSVLAEAGRPLHVGEILQRLTAQGWSVPGADPVAALNTRLWKRSGPGGRLKRLGGATYALSEGDDGRTAN